MQHNKKAAQKKQLRNCIRKFETKTESFFSHKTLASFGSVSFKDFVTLHEYFKCALELVLYRYMF